MRIRRTIKPQQMHLNPRHHTWTQCSAVKRTAASHPATPSVETQSVPDRASATRRQVGLPPPSRAPQDSAPCWHGRGSCGPDSTWMTSLRCEPRIRDEIPRPTSLQISETHKNGLQLPPKDAELFGSHSGNVELRVAAHTPTSLRVWLAPVVRRYTCWVLL